MLLVDKSIHDIQAGYQRIINADLELLRNWRDPLLEIYAQQRSVYEQELETYKKRRSESFGRIRIGIWLSSILLILGLIILPVLITITELGDLRGPLLCFSPLLILGGATGWAIIGVLWFWQRDQVKPAPPNHPLKTNLIHPMIPIWKTGLQGLISGKKPTDSEKGIYSFIARLQTIDPETYILHKLQIAPDEVIDVVLVGTRGVWVFEVINRDGVIRWREGRWTYRRTYLRVSGTALTEIKESEKSYDQLWRSASDNLIVVIQESLPDLVESIPNIIRVRGGLVFSHPKGKLDIPPGCPFNWGIIPFWMDKLKDMPSVAGLDELVIFQILEALLTKHQQITGILEPRSMLTFANELIEQGGDQITQYIQAADLKSEIPTM